jgi:hypothetical protein
MMALIGFAQKHHECRNGHVFQNCNYGDSA